MKKLIALMLTALMILGMFTACGSSEKENDDVLVVAMELAYPPFETKDEAGNPSGISVDFASMEFLFMNSKANAATVSEAAYKACEADVLAECQNQQAILEFAARGAENVIRALLSPFLQQAGLDYTLIFTQEVTGL